MEFRYSFHWDSAKAKSEASNVAFVEYFSGLKLFKSYFIMLLLLRFVQSNQLQQAHANFRRLLTQNAKSNSIQNSQQRPQVQLTARRKLSSQSSVRRGKSFQESRCSCSHPGDQAPLPTQVYTRASWIKSEKNTLASWSVKFPRVAGGQSYGGRAPVSCRGTFELLLKALDAACARCSCALGGIRRGSHQFPSFGKLRARPVAFVGVVKIKLFGLMGTRKLFVCSPCAFEGQRAFLILPD